MRKILGVRDSWEGCEEFLGVFLDNKRMSAAVDINGDSEHKRGVDTFKLPAHRWGLANAPANHTFRAIYDQVEDSIQDFLNSTKNGLIVFIANGAREITEIAGCADASGLSSPNTAKGIANSQTFTLLAYHQSHAILRGIRKADSIGTSVVYWSTVGPFMTPFWVARGIKGGARAVANKAFGKGKKEGMVNV